MKKVFLIILPTFSLIMPVKLVIHNDLICDEYRNVNINGQIWRSPGIHYNKNWYHWNLDNDTIELDIQDNEQFYIDARPLTPFICVLYWAEFTLISEENPNTKLNVNLSVLTSRNIKKLSLDSNNWIIFNNYREESISQKMQNWTNRIQNWIMRTEEEWRKKISLWIYKPKPGINHFMKQEDLTSKNSY